MINKKYIGVVADNIRLIMHTYDDNMYGKNVYPKPKGIAFTIGTATEIFNSYGIPEEYQRMFMIVNNNLSMLYQDIRDHSINLYAAKFNRFKTREYIIGTPIYIAYNSRHELFGQQAAFPCTFDVSNCYLCDKDEVENFMVKLREKGLLENYIKSIAEISHLRVDSQFKYEKNDEEDTKNKLVKK